METKRARKLNPMAMVIVMLVVAATVYLAIQVVPRFGELKQRTPGKFSAMVKEAKSFHLIRAVNLLQEMHRMSNDEALMLRYQGMMHKRSMDETFRDEDWKKQLESREKSQSDRLHAHRNELLELQKSSVRSDRSGTFLWSRAGPWQRSLALREKCRKYLKLESRRDSGAAANKCDLWVPLTHDAEVLDASIQALMERLNYFSFVELLKELGMISNEVLLFRDQLERMTQSFGGS